MKRHTLTETENREASSIIENYREIEKELTDVQEQLLQLDFQKEQLLLRLDETRKAEEDYFISLTEKYGEGKLDLLTFEYVTIKNEKV
jgi:hypothetical protein